MRHVFVSYKHKDSVFAGTLIKHLQEAGFDTWQDDGQLHAGEDWRIEIDQAIKNAIALIVIVTPEAKSSEYVTYEWAYAYGAGIKVIPVILQPVLLHPRLAVLQHLDFSRRHRPWSKLIEEITLAERESLPYVVNLPPDTPLFIKQAIQVLESANRFDRKNALETLAQASHPAAYQALMKALLHPMQDVRIHASLVLSKDLGTLPGILEALQNEDKDVRTHALQMLERFASVILPAFLEALNDNDTNIRNSAVTILRKLGTTMMPRLLDALKDQNPDVRYNVIATLGLMGIAMAPGFREAFKDNNSDVRYRSAACLSDLGPAMVTSLGEALKDKHFGIRYKAAEVLKQIYELIKKEDVL